MKLSYFSAIAIMCPPLYGACVIPNPTDPIFIDESTSRSDQRYIQNGQSVCLHSHSEIFQNIQPEYRKYKATYNTGLAMMSAGALLPALWIVEIAYEISKGKPLHLDYFNNYTVIGSSILILTGMIPTFMAVQQLEIMIGKHNARVQINIPIPN